MGASESVSESESASASQRGFVEGKNVMVTGCTSGIGRQVVFQLAEKKPKLIYLACRNKAKGEALRDELAAQNVKSQVVLGDMATARGCVDIARQVIATGEPLQAVVSNAGIWEAFNKEKVLSPDGLETHFGTNYMSMVILLTELKPLLESSAPARVTITGSFTSINSDPRLGCPNPSMAGVVDFENLQGEKGVTKTTANDIMYIQSKLLQYMWAKKFSQSVKDGVVVSVFDPGWCETSNKVIDLLKSMVKCLFPVVKWTMGIRSAADGAEPAVWACDSHSKEAQEANGKYIDWGTVGKPVKNDPVPLGEYPSFVKQSNKGLSASTLDAAQVDRLWEYTEKVRKDLMP